MRQAYDYWQDQPGNCPTRTGHRWPHEAAGTRARALSPARVSHRPIKVVPLWRKLRGGVNPRGQRTIRTPLPEFLVPRSHTPQGRSPGPADQSRPLRWRLPSNGRASLRRASGTRRISNWLVAEQIGPEAIKSTSLSIDGSSVKGALHVKHFRL